MSTTMKPTITQRIKEAVRNFLTPKDEQIETVRSTRDRYRKWWMECRTEITTLKAKLDDALNERNDALLHYWERKQLADKLHARRDKWRGRYEEERTAHQYWAGLAIQKDEEIANFKQAFREATEENNRLRAQIGDLIDSRTPEEQEMPREIRRKLVFTREDEERLKRPMLADALHPKPLTEQEAEGFTQRLQEKRVDTFVAEGFTSGGRRVHDLRAPSKVEQVAPLVFTHNQGYIAYYSREDGTPRFVSASKEFVSPPSKTYPGPISAEEYELLRQTLPEVHPTEMRFGRCCR